ncbi:MAG TPA: hypothetical protein VH598_16300, partial [Verrucomicrobiae bacterium]|nr:hypothetical protein [Verrucomicrobiae bacterium]
MKVETRPSESKLLLIFALSAIFLVTTPSLQAGATKIALPLETASFKPGPGSELANAQCLTCHSVEYVLTQPPLPQTFWASSVKKMREKFGASIPEDQVEPLVKYLTANYGTPANPPSNLQPAADQKTAPAPAQTGNVE